MIKLGLKEIDIIHCFVKHGIMAYEPLLVVELLILTKEVVRDKKDNLRLTQKLERVPQHIVDLTKECMEK